MATYYDFNSCLPALRKMSTGRDEESDDGEDAPWLVAPGVRAALEARLPAPVAVGGAAAGWAAPGRPPSA